MAVCKPSLTYREKGRESPQERKSRAVFVQVAGGPVVAAVLPWSRRVIVQALSFEAPEKAIRKVFWSQNGLGSVDLWEQRAVSGWVGRGKCE